MTLGINKLIKTEIVFAFIASFCGAIFIFTIPPLWGLDESSHFARVYQISKGDVLPNREPGPLYGGAMPKEFNNLTYYSLIDIGEEKDLDIFTRKDINNRQGYKKYTDSKFSSDLVPALNPASYSFMAYPLSVLAVIVANSLDFTIGQTLSVARFGSLFTYIPIVALAIWLLRNYKIKWMLFVFALLPVMVFQASVLSADTIVNAFSLLFFSLIFRLLKEKSSWDKSKKLIYPLAVIAILIPIAKLNYIFISMVFILLPSVCFRNKLSERLLKVFVIVFSLTATIWWALISKVTESSGFQPRDGIILSSSDQISFLVSHPWSFLPIVFRSVIQNGDVYIRETFTVVGWNYVQLPLIVLIVTVFALAATVIYAKDEVIGLRKYTLVVICLMTLSAISIFGSLYVAFTPTANSIVDGVQGRYFLPLLLPVIILAGSLLPFKIENRSINCFSAIFTFSSLLVLISSLVYYLMATY